MAKQQSGVNTRGIGLELQRLRKEKGVNLAEVGEAFGMSASTLSRIETGKREATSEEVASILTALAVKGLERERLIEQARRQGEAGLMDTAGSSEQSRNYVNFEQEATRITVFELMLVPGLAQTANYAHAVLSTLRPGDSEQEIEAWVRQRIGRQAILTRGRPPELHWILTEMGLRYPLGGAKVMARQVRHLIELTERSNIKINVIPAKVVAHPGLSGQFVVLDFAAEPSVVCVEAKTTGLFLDDPDKVAVYKLTVEKLTDLALDERASVRLMRSIATDLDRE